MNCAIYPKDHSQKPWQEVTDTYRDHQTEEPGQLEERKRMSNRQDVDSALDGHIATKADRCRVFVRRR